MSTCFMPPSWVDCQPLQLHPGRLNKREGFDVEFRRFKALGCAALLLVSAGWASVASAQQRFPTRPISVVVPASAGGPSDAVARIIAEAMSRGLGQQVIVENVAGGGGTIGSVRVARARPDGHTLLL